MRHQLWICCALLLWAGALYAGPKEDAAKQRKEAERLFTRGDYAQALLAYDEAHALYADPSDWLGRAQVLIKLRRFSEANDAYQQFLALGKAGKKQKEIERAIEDLSIILETKLSCTSTPIGATVYLNSRVDEPLGKTPLENNIPPGTHRLIFEKEGFEPQIQTVTIEPRSAQSINAELMPAPGLLSVTTSPQSAELKLNGELRGKTPLETKLQDGVYEVEVSAPGYPTQRRTFDVKAPQRYTWSIDLTQPPVGTLSLKVTPRAARVTVDGKELPSGDKIELKPGIYPILIAADGYKPQQQEVTIESSQTQTLTAKLESNQARLQLRANRAEYSVSLNDEPVALDSTGGILLPGGEQRLSLQAPKASAWSQQIDLTKDTLAEITFKDAPRPLTKVSLGAGAGLLATSGLFSYAGLARALLINQLCDPDAEGFDPARCNTSNAALVQIDKERGAFFKVAIGTGVIGAAMLSYGIYKKRREGKTSVRLKEQGATP